jgi:hypothetical protein
VVAAAFSRDSSLLVLGTLQYKVHVVALNGGVGAGAGAAPMLQASVNALGTESDPADSGDDDAGQDSSGEDRGTWVVVVWKRWWL